MVRCAANVPAVRSRGDARHLKCVQIFVTTLSVRNEIHLPMNVPTNSPTRTNTVRCAADAAAAQTLYHVRVLLAMRAISDLSILTSCTINSHLHDPYRYSYTHQH